MGRANRPLWGCGAVSHVAADAAAVTIMERDRNVLVGADKGTVLAPRPLQPLRRAAYENSKAGKKALDVAVGHWQEDLHGVPRLSFGERRPSKDGIGFPRMTPHSKSLGEIDRRAADDLSVWESAVLMSSAARALASRGIDGLRGFRPRGRRNPVSCASASWAGHAVQALRRQLLHRPRIDASRAHPYG
jgi:hypothetical protein